MPKLQARVVQHLEKKGKVYTVVLMNGKQPKVGEVVSIKFGATRTNSQNALYFVFLQWLLDSGLKDEYGSTDELHESLKAAFLSKVNDFGLLKIGSTTELGKDEFADYLEKINREASQTWGIDTSIFWSEYETNHQVA
jgi:hypothetical protein